MDDIPGFVFALITVVGCSWIAYGMTGLAHDASWQRKAVDAGHAEFYINEDGGRAWRWKDHNEQEQNHAE